MDRRDTQIDLLRFTKENVFNIVDTGQLQRIVEYDIFRYVISRVPFRNIAAVCIAIGISYLVIITLFCLIA